MIYRLLHLSMTLMGLNASLMSAESTVTAEANPLLAASPLPYQYPPFDKIKDSHYASAFESAMAENLVEVEKVTASLEEPTFENTIIALERSGQTLTRVNSVFSSLASAHTNPALQAIESDIAPKLSAHIDAILLNSKLFGRLKTLYDERESLDLDPESKRVVERYYRDFARAGAKLSDSDKTKLKVMNAEVAMLETEFTQNVQKEKNAASILVNSQEELAGLPDNEIAAAAEAAKEDGKEGKFVIRMMNTTGQPALS